MAATSGSIALRNGLKMPTVGLGLWKLEKSTAADQVYNAIKAGYRLLDGASDYGNEVEVGQGIRRALDEGLVKRSDLFITGKLWNTYHRREHIRPAIDRSLSDLGLDYLDLYLIHFPIALKYVPFDVRYPAEWSYEVGGPVIHDNVPYRETWEGMEELYEAGLAKNIGISNTAGALIYDVLSYAKVKPAVLQIEVHPYLVRKQLVDLAHAEGIAVTAFSSFGDSSYQSLNMVPTNTKPLLQHDLISEIAAKHGKTPAQILLRWAIERGCAVIPKSSNPKRLHENLDLFGFSLSAEEVERINGLNQSLIFNDPAIYAKRPIWAC
ncbi:NAD(P)H-dependent D-xylose reductase xyl1 [Martensiomyces pterosporus]|nr:NAD(P)H-dependent D-xylose reductase xyl1 [Martensiomyces pterosporus]